MTSLLHSLGLHTAAFGKGALLGLGAAVLVLFVCKVSGLLKRQNKAHNLVVKLYYLYIPVVFAGFLGAWFAVADMRIQVSRGLDVARPIVTQASVEAANALMDELKKRYPEGAVSLKEGLLPAVRVYLGEKFFHNVAGAPAIPPVLQPLMDTAASFLSGKVAEEIERRMLERAASAVNIDTKDLREFWAGDIITTMKKGLVMNLLEKHLFKPFEAMQGMVRNTGIFLLLPVALETAVSLWFARRRQAQEALAA